VIAGTFNHRFRRAVIRWTVFVRAHALAVTLIAAALVGLSGLALATRFAVNTDTSEMLSPRLPFLAHSKAERQAFPQYRGVLVVVVEAPSVAAAERAGQRLAARFREEPALFGDVFYPQGDPFFRRNGLLFLQVEDVQRLSGRMLEGQPFMAAVAADPSLRGLFGVLGLALDHAQSAGPDLATILNGLAEAVERHRAGGPETFSLRDLAGGEPQIGLDQRRQIIVLRPRLDFGSTRPAEQAMRRVREIAAETEVAETFGATVRLTGDAALDTEELGSVESGTTAAGFLSLGLVVVLLWLCFHSVRLIAIMLVTVIAGLLWTAAFAAVVVGPFNIISLTFAVLYIGLGADFSIHYMMRYLQALRTGAGQGQSWRQTARDIGGALTLSALAAAIGFGAFLPTDYRGLAELGLIASAGMFIALVSNLTMLPALATLFPPVPPTFSGWIRRRAMRVTGWVTDHDRPIVVAAAALALGSAALFPSLKFDADPLNLKSPASEAVATLLDLRRDGWDNRYVISAVAPTLAEAEALADRAAALPTVGTTRTLADFVPARQDEKLALIDQVATILEPALDVPAAASASAADDAAAITGFRRRLENLAASGGSPPAEAAGRLARALAPFADDPQAAEGLRNALIGGAIHDIAALEASLAAHEITLESLPDSLRDRWLTVDGRVRLEITPRADIREDPAELRAFVESVQSVVPTAAGEPVLILGARDTILKAFYIAAGISFLAIGLMLLLVLPTLREVALVFAPIVWAAIVTVGFAVLVGIPFNLANIIALPLLFGLGVAGSVQFVVRTRTEQGTRAALQSSTPRAVFFSFLTAISSFGSLAIVDHPGIATMGILLTTALTVALMSTLIVLPAGMHWLMRRPEH
jgi:hypothetical protein